MLVVLKDWKALLRGLALVTVACTTLTVAGQGLKARNQDSPETNISKGIQIIRSDVHHDVSLPLRDLIQARQRVIVPPGEVDEAEPLLVESVVLNGLDHLFRRADGRVLHQAPKLRLNTKNTSVHSV